MPDVSVLTVRLHGRPIGTLTHVGGDRTLFAFNDDYVNDRDRPTLSLGFKDVFGELITDLRPTQTRLLPFFANLLPEDPLRRYLADRAGVNPVREFFLLGALGEDLPGAVTVTPADGDAWPHDDSDDAAHRRDSRETALRFSLAGVQLKFSAVRAAGGGLTIPVTGAGGRWIVKLPSPRFAGVPENEYSMMTLAQRVGIDVPAVQLVDLATIGNLPRDVGQELEGQALAVERFDREKEGEGGGAVHMEDFAQVFGVYPEEKYGKASMKSVGRVIAAEGSERDSVEFIRRLTFNTLIGNADMHLKNWSLLYPDRRHAALAPAYDLVATIAYIRDEQAALTVSRTKRFDAFSEDELAHLSAKALLPEKLVLDTARDTVERFHQHWHAEKNHWPIDKAAVQAIDQHLKTVPLAKA